MILDNIWLINLDQSENRLDSVKYNFNKLNLKFNRFSAIDGKKLSMDDIKKYTNDICNTIICNHAMIGCALSHKKLWEQLINDNNANSYLILEDDIVLDEKSVDIIKKLDKLQINENIDVINLYGQNGLNTIKNKLYRIDDIDLGFAYYPLTTTAYMITKIGAKKLLEGINKLNFPIDHEIALIVNALDIKYLVTNPFIVKTLDIDSTIGSKKNCILLYICKLLNFKYLYWKLMYPSLNINLIYKIDNIVIMYVILFFINKNYIKSDLLQIFILIELFLLFSY
jgi:glycosyl transferase family 25